MFDSGFLQKGRSNLTSSRGPPSSPQPTDRAGRGKGCWCPGDPGWGEGNSGLETEPWAWRTHRSRRYVGRPGS